MSNEPQSNKVQNPKCESCRWRSEVVEYFDTIGGGVGKSIRWFCHFNPPPFSRVQPGEFCSHHQPTTTTSKNSVSTLN